MKCRTTTHDQIKCLFVKRPDVAALGCAARRVPTWSGYASGRGSHHADLAPGSGGAPGSLQGNPAKQWRALPLHAGTNRKYTTDMPRNHPATELYCKSRAAGGSVRTIAREQSGNAEDLPSNHATIAGRTVVPSNVCPIYLSRSTYVYVDMCSRTVSYTHLRAHET